MQAFDFDNTIYKGESSFDFAVFVIKRNKKLLKYLPGIAKILFSYKVCRMSVDDFLKSMEKYTAIFLENKETIQNLVTEFWQTHERKLYLNMLEKIHFNDVIVTASPDFLIKGIAHRLHTKHILCTKTDFDQGKITYLNFKENKVASFKKAYPHKIIKNFYTDSYNDRPFMEFSKNVYLVNHGDCTKIK